MIFVKLSYSYLYFKSFLLNPPHSDCSGMGYLSSIWFLSSLFKLSVACNKSPSPFAWHTDHAPFRSFSASFVTIWQLTYLNGYSFLHTLTYHAHEHAQHVPLCTHPRTCTHTPQQMQHFNNCYTKWVEPLIWASKSQHNSRWPAGGQDRTFVDFLWIYCNQDWPVVW